MKLNPKPGFYQIKDVYPQTNKITKKDDFYARYAFKENIENKFVDIGMSIRLHTLFHQVSECLNGDKLQFQKDPTRLINEIIHIQSYELVDYTIMEITFKVNKVKWLILNHEVISKRIPGLKIASEDELNKIYISNDFESEDAMDYFDPQDEEIYEGL